MDIPIFVINLDRATDRLGHATAQLKGQGLSFRRLPAVDGARLAESEISRVHDEVRSRAVYHVPMQRGEIACFLSHRRAWQAFLDETAAPFAVIVEDDFAFMGELRPVLEALAVATLDPWDVIKLWGKDKRLFRRVAALTPSFALVREPVLSKRTVGQIVSRAGAEALLARTLPIIRPIDVQLQYPWELGIEVLTIRPSLVVDVGEQKFGISSTKDAIEGFGTAKAQREVRRILLQASLAARSLVRFAKLR